MPTRRRRHNTIIIDPLAYRVIPDLPQATVHDYGAIGDGVHDDTAAFEKMIADVGYVTLALVPKSYRLTKLIRLPGNGFVAMARDESQSLNDTAKL